MKDNKLDKFFREKAEGVEPEFDPKFWEQAERMLDALPEEERRRRAAWWWLLPLLLISGCGSLWWLGVFGGNENITSIKQETLSQEKIDEKQERNTVNTESLQEKEDMNIQIKKELVDLAKSDANFAKNKMENSTQNSIQNEKIAIEKSAQSNYLKSKNQTHLLLDFSDESEIISLRSTPKITAGKKKNTKVITPKIEDKKIPQAISLSTKNINFLQCSLPEITDSIRVDTINFLRFTNPKEARWGWSLGATVQPDLFVNTKKDILLAVRAGLTYDYQLNKKWDLHFDLLGKCISQTVDVYDDLGAQDSGIKYGFGRTNFFHFYRLKTQFFLEGVSLLRYKINTHHAIGAGVGVKYLMSAHGDLVRYNFFREIGNNSSAFKSINEVVDSGWWKKAYTQDFLPFLQVRYDYRTSRNSTLFFKINAEHNIGWYVNPRASLVSITQIETSFGYNYQF